MAGDVLFVRWTSAALRKARRISLDDRNGLKWIVAFAIPEESFDGYEVMVDDAGVNIIKGTKAFRPIMP